MSRQPPKIIKEVGFDFDWDEKKVWALDLPVEEMDIDELVWHFDVPFLWTKPDGYYNLKPDEVLKNPKKYQGEYDRTQKADLSHPIDIMHWRGRWLILDGLHRLMKASSQGKAKIEVRKVPQSEIPKILKD
ncbi:MAG: hypothetical protein HZB70_00405 [Candidatus Berkelbacteria bacterium]|nr:MAG: hypothetical protein HZB70_00405 [Candidatus Berkelbacteria bacterium]QQG51432.1 MAG: hypothetical protein HY845_02595 [Candidatus Berkelbacteria bacterium]